MDPNSPAPIQTPEQQLPTPTPAPQQPLTPAPQQPVPNGQPPKKLGKGAIFAIIGGALFVILLIIGIVIAVNAMTKENSTDSNRTNDSAKTDDTDDETITDPSANAITAKALIELRVSCVGGSTTNAGAFAKPYRYVAYENNNYGTAEREVEKWDMYAVGSNDESITVDDRSAPSELNVVVCLSRDDSTAVKTMSCELLRPSGVEQGASTVADYHSVKYKVTLYEAQSGKKIKELAAINGPATECPAVKYYNPESPDIYGDPDGTELNARLETFEQ